MSENIEKTVPTEESLKTKESETSAPAATDNVVLYPVADISAAQETTDTETAASKEITDPQNTDNQTTIDSKTTDGKAADNADKFAVIDFKVEILEKRCCIGSSDIKGLANILKL